MFRTCLILFWSPTALLAAAATAEGSCEQLETDQTSFLQTSVKQGSARDASSGRALNLKHKADSCACLPWQEVYKTHGVSCGQGNELTSFGGVIATLNKDLMNEFCTLFFEKLPFSMCMKVGYQTADTSTWCYASKDCEIAGKVIGDAKVRACDEHEDQLIGSRPITDLVKIAAENDLDMGLLFMFSWPQYQGTKGVTWFDVEDYFLHGESPKDERASTSALELIITSGRPMLFASRDMHPPHTVVIGKAVYQLVFSEWMQEQLDTGEDFWRHPFLMESLTCLKGDGHAVLRVNHQQYAAYIARDALGN